MYVQHLQILKQMTYQYVTTGWFNKTLFKPLLHYQFASIDSAASFFDEAVVAKRCSEGVALTAETETILFFYVGTMCRDHVVPLFCLH